MQGRLSPLIDGRIQAFPWPFWQDEFPIAEKLGFNLVEWTLDQDRLYDNPLLTVDGQTHILALRHKHRFEISSLTGDCFMQAPFWKSVGTTRRDLERDFLAVAKACSAVGIRMMVVPLVDNGRLENVAEEDALVDFLRGQSEFLAAGNIQIVFESDFGPAELARFIARLDSHSFGINYDIGNSAALGFDPVEEIRAYGERIINVHVKDRRLGGTTVPLGTGDANFDAVFSGLAHVGYAGNYILQTARAASGDHAEVLCKYRDMTAAWIENHGA